MVAKQRNSRRRGLLLASAALVLTVASVDGFVAPHSVPNRIRPATTSESLHYYNLHATKEGEDLDTDTRRRRESPLRVRRRVRAVIEKARSTKKSGSIRTSIRTRLSASSIVADAASIGGLGGVVVDQEGTVDVALDMREAKNGFVAPVKDPASTPSPVIKTKTVPEDELVVAKSVELAPKNGVVVEESLKKEMKRKSRVSQAEVDALKADIPAAYAEPLPFTLPNLSNEQRVQLKAGERLQEQSKMGREGSGYVVFDIKAPPYVIWETLLNFESYPQTIPTVRDVRFFSSNKLSSGYHAEKPIDPTTGRQLRHYGTPSTTRAAFCLSKFRLNIAAIHNYRPHPDGDYMIFTLDPECTNLVLKSAKGIWHVQRNPDGRGNEWCRVWLLCEVKVSSLLPSFIVEYTAQRAMPRATTWLKPQVDAAAQLWLKNAPP